MSQLPGPTVCKTGAPYVDGRLQPYSAALKVRFSPEELDDAKGGGQVKG